MLLHRTFGHTVSSDTNSKYSIDLHSKHQSNNNLSNRINNDNSNNTKNNSIADSKTVYITSGDSGVLKELGTDSKWATSLITAHQFPITTTVLDTIFPAGKSKSGEADHSTGVFLYCCAVLTLKSKTESLSTSCCSRSSGDR